MWETSAGGVRALKNFSSSAAYSITKGLNFLSQISACGAVKASVPHGDCDGQV